MLPILQTILITVHLLVVVAIVIVVLLQRSEGGALGIGGGGGGLMTARGAANALTRTTAYLAGAFFITSIALAITASYQAGAPGLFDNLSGAQQQQNGAVPGAAPGSDLGETDLLQDLNVEPAAPSAPVGDGAPAATSAPAPAPAPAPTAAAPTTAAEPAVAPTTAEPAPPAAPSGDAAPPAAPAAGGATQQP